MSQSVARRVVVFLILSNCLVAEEPTVPEPTPPQAARASDEGQRALSGFRIPEGLEGQLFAAEPLVANPVAFFIDSKGRVYVCETFRQKVAIEDNRDHGEWLDDDLAAQSIDDRLAYLRKHLGEKVEEYTHHDDRIRLLQDTDGDGKADKSAVFANRFNEVLAGTGAGVLEHQGNVYYTCIPHLWMLRDTNDDGIADERMSLHKGYGVRFAFRGHDMHGLTIGPDGKLYYSIGDRGYNVKTNGRHHVNPESGAVFRCNLDGSDLEVVYTGLRNPQELAFDDFGNLFTVDNNSDSGDKARLVYLAEGGESGWRMAYQYLSDRGPFNREKIWHPFCEDQPAYIIPPIANISDGPAGLAYYPGTGLSDEYKGRFFLCDFRGAAGQSGIRSFRVKPNGAFFEIADQEQPFWNILATDIAFGPDGAVYISDWVHGWDGLGKGRIYRFFNPEMTEDAQVLEVKNLLAADLTQRPSKELAGLLAHQDRRVRLSAQFALAEKGDVETLSSTAHQKDDLLARIHALWGLGQIGRRREGLLNVVEVALTLLDDDDAEVRAQAVKLAGDLRLSSLASKLTSSLEDDSSRVRYFAALSLGKIGHKKAAEPILEMLANNDDRDPIVRHGGVMSLAGTKDFALLKSLAKHHSPSARRGVLLAMRRLENAEVALFLGDPDESLVLEAARAIHDVPIRPAMPVLAKWITHSSQNDALLRRVLNANYRLGEQSNANALAAFAARSDAPEAMRIEALEMLESWSKPSSRDRVLGMWRPLGERDQSMARNAMAKELAGILSASEAVRIPAARVAARLGIEQIGPFLHKLIKDKSQHAQARADALLALASLKDEKLGDTIQVALHDESPILRSSARQVLADVDPQSAIDSLRDAVFNGELVERQSALTVLARIEDKNVDTVFSQALDKLFEGEFPADTQLDLLEAAKGREASDIQAKLAKFESARSPDDPLASFRETLEGGDADKGRTIFFERRDVSCLRCHKIGGTGGEVGPGLSKIGADKKRDYILESIVLPSRTMAKGFETIMLATDDGLVHSGILKHEDAKVVRLMTAKGEILEIATETIEERSKGKSAMPEDLLKHLSKADIRDLVEFLANQKATAVEQ